MESEGVELSPDQMGVDPGPRDAKLENAHVLLQHARTLSET